MMNINGESNTNGDKWTIEKIRSGPCTVTPPLLAVDTSLCFGYGPSAGTYGVVQDAGLDILRAVGIGPVIAWVDNHLFIWLPQIGRAHV